MASRTPLELLWWLIVGHAVMDFWAQSDALAQMKNRKRSNTRVPPGQKPQTMWAYALTAHALHHGFAVAFITGSVGLGVAETVWHWFIDFGKCENWYGIHVDQALHLVCKCAWLTVVVYG